MAVVSASLVKENISDHNLIDVAKKNTKEYGTHVIQNRALPDYRDGLKPVSRRILWVAYENNMLPKGQYYKSARVVGDVMGKYHPHGDMAIYDALVKMVNNPVTPMDKKGNFGAVNDSSTAAMRYTEVRMSEYGYKAFFNKYVEKVVDMVPNYDGHEKEPLFLPCLYPNLLMNGTSGIGVGVTCDIPPLHIESLMPFIEQAIKGEELSTKRMAKNLRFNYKYGSHCVSSVEEIVNWIKYGSQSLWFEPNYQLDSAKRTITVTEAPPNFNLEKIIEKLMGTVGGKGKNKDKKRYEFISSVDDECKNIKETGKTDIKFVVKLKNTIDPDEFSNLAKIVIKEFTNYVKTATNVTHRSTKNIKFIPTNIPNLITLWSKYRIDMEKRITQCIIDEISKNIAHKDLMLLAINNRKIITDALEVSKPYNYVEEKLNLTSEQSHIMLGWSVISLAKISKNKVIGDKQELIANKKEQQKILENPQPKILNDMSAGIKYLK